MSSRATARARHGDRGRDASLRALQFRPALRIADELRRARHTMPRGTHRSQKEESCMSRSGYNILCDLFGVKRLKNFDPSKITAKQVAKLSEDDARKVNRFLTQLNGARLETDLRQFVPKAL